MKTSNVCAQDLVSSRATAWHGATGVVDALNETLAAISAPGKQFIDLRESDCTGVDPMLLLQSAVVWGWPHRNVFGQSQIAQLVAGRVVAGG